MKRTIKTPPPDENGIFNLALIHVDALLERIQTRKLKSFEPSLIKQLAKLSKEDLKRLNHYYHTSYEDMKGALAGDDYLIEAYSNYDRDQMKVALAMYKAIKAVKHDDSAKGRFGNHGPRKHKQKPPEQIVKKLLFMEKDPETGISSLKPEQLVGAAELWIYNVKTRKLGCYYAKSGAGLSAKGTKILNYDEKRSTTKTIRKPKLQITEFIGKSPTEMHRYWDAIRAVPQEIAPRTSRETIILRAIDTSD